MWGLPFCPYCGTLLGWGNGFLSMSPAHLALGYSFWSCAVRLTWPLCNGLAGASQTLTFINIVDSDSVGLW